MYMYCVDKGMRRLEIRVKSEYNTWCCLVRASVRPFVRCVYLYPGVIYRSEDQSHVRVTVVQGLTTPGCGVPLPVVAEVHTGDDDGHVGSEQRGGGSRHLARARIGI